MPSQNTLRLSGRTGRLLWGSRVVTEFRTWAVEPNGAEYLVKIGRHDPDPVYWDYHGENLRVELDIGRHQLVRPTRIVTAEPLLLAVDGLET